MTDNTGRRPAGFTLIEMLVVVGVFLLLAVATAPFLFRLGRGKSIRDAGRIVQATLVGARDRALASGRPVGVRLIPDAANPSLVRTMIYIRAADPYSPPNGTVHVVRSWPTATLMPDIPAFQDEPQPGVGGVPPLPIDLVIANGSIDFSPFLTGGIIRLANSGSYFAFDFVDSRKLRLRSSTLAKPIYNPVAAIGIPTTGNNAADRNTFDQRLQGLAPLAPSVSPILAQPQASEGIGFSILRDVVPLEGAEPIPLPAGVVIDLGELVTGSAPEDRLSRLEFKGILPNVDWDILFAPSGQVLPPQAGLKFAGIWLREEDANMGLAGGGGVLHRTVNTRDTTTHVLITINTTSGFVSAQKPRLQNLLPDDDSNGIADDGEWDWEAYYADVPKGDTRGL